MLYTYSLIEPDLFPHGELYWPNLVKSRRYLRYSSIPYIRPRMHWIVPLHVPGVAYRWEYRRSWLYFFSLPLHVCRSPVSIFPTAHAHLCPLGPVNKQTPLHRVPSQLVGAERQRKYTTSHWAWSRQFTLNCNPAWLLSLLLYFLFLCASCTIL